MAERRKREEEFYEAMPGTMEQPGVRRERSYFDDDDDLAREDYEHNSILPWVLVAVVIVLLGLLLLGGLSLNRGTSNTSGNTQTQQAAQPAVGTQNLPK
jgi:hypothetical protein